MGVSAKTTLPAFIAAAAQQYGDKIAIQEGSASISYKDLDQQRRQAAKAFIAAGIKHGDAIAIWAPNISPWIIATLGLQSIGAVLVPLSTRMKGSEAAFQLNRSAARLLLTVPDFQASPKSVLNFIELIADEDLPHLEQTICLQNAYQDCLTWEAFLAAGNDVTDAALTEAEAKVKPDDVMDMLFTSGTTGQPKGVLCAHEQNLRVFQTWADTVGLNSDDNYLIINPFFHSFGYKAGWLAALIKGSKILPVLSFDLDAVMQQISDDKVTMLPGPPTIYQSLLAHPKRDDYDLSSLRLAVTGAAAVPVELVKKMRSELNFETVVTAYGLTESCGVVSICRPDDSAEIIATTSGRAIEGVEVKCVDGDGKEVARGEPGEIWVKGYNVMLGYYDNAEATAETITPDGWMKTGDIGVMDEQGYIKITDRLKDMYICGGFNVYPAELENAFSGIEGVSQVAVIGVPDERMGEVGKAFIVKMPGASLSEDDVIAWAKQNLSNYKVPRQVVMLDAMPLNASGKILKTELRKL